MPRLSRRFVRVAKKPSTALSQEADVAKLERPSRMVFEPSANIGMMGGVIVDDGVDRLSNGNGVFLDDIEEANELLMAMALHVAADHRAVEDVHRGEQRRRAVALIVVRHGSGAALLQRQSGLCAVKRRNSAFFVDRQDDGVCGGIDIEPHDVAQFVDEARIVGQLELAHPVVADHGRARCVGPNSR